MEALLFVIIFGGYLCNLLGFTPDIITYYARTINGYLEIVSKIMFDFTNYSDLDAFYMIDYIDMSGKLPMGVAGNLPHVRYSAAYPTGRERIAKGTPLPWGHHSIRTMANMR